MLPTKFQFIWRFQRRRLKCKKLTDDRRRAPSDGKSSHCLWQGELKIQISNHLLNSIELSIFLNDIILVYFTFELFSSFLSIGTEC